MAESWQMGRIGMAGDAVHARAKWFWRRAGNEKGLPLQALFRVFQVDRGGIEHPHKSPAISGDSRTGGAESGAPDGSSATLADPHLARIVAAWAALADDVRAKILELVALG
jgi:hypothetical protein